MFKFEYAIKFPDGEYYTGRAGEGFTGPKHEAFTLTEEGAHRLLDNWQSRGFWEGAIVERQA